MTAPCPLHFMVSFGLLNLTRCLCLRLRLAANGMYWGRFLRWSTVFYHITFQRNGWREVETVFSDGNNIGKQICLEQKQISMPYFTGAIVL